MKVLYIEDNEEYAALIRKVMAWQVEMVRVPALIPGLRKLAQEPFDVVLLDLNLPDSTGEATFNALHASWPQMPVVVLSGFLTEDLIELLIRGGAVCCLCKQEMHEPMRLKQNLLRALQKAGPRMEIANLVQSLATMIRAHVGSTV